MHSVKIPKMQEMTNASQETVIWSWNYSTVNAVDYLVSLSSFLCSTGSRITSPTRKTSQVFGQNLMTFCSKIDPIVSFFLFPHLQTINNFTLK